MTVVGRKMGIKGTRYSELKTLGSISVPDTPLTMTKSGISSVIQFLHLKGAATLARKRTGVLIWETASVTMCRAYRNFIVL